VVTQTKFFNEDYNYIIIDLFISLVICLWSRNW